jgi:hypothetical protein
MYVRTHEDSIRRSLPELKEDASLQDSFDLILRGNETPSKAKTLSLLSLLHDLGGDIQKGSKRFFPFFCESTTNATFPRARVGLLKTEGKDLVPNLLWNSDLGTEPERVIRQLKFEYFANPNESVPPIKGNEAKERLLEALENPQIIAALPAEVQIAIRKTLESASFEVEIPRYFFGGAGAELRKLRLDLFLLAKNVLPHSGLLHCLRNTFKPTAPSKKSAKVDDTESMLRSMDNDPLIIARGARGYIFPSFTSHPLWEEAADHLPVWRDFDIAAFAEALKSLNQFAQKTDERDGKLQSAQQTLDYMLGISKELPKSTEGDGEVKAPPRPGLDPRWPLVGELEKELGENLNEGNWQLSRSALRGLNDIIELWNKHPDGSVEILQGDVKSYQANEKNKRDIGSVQLFLLLCEERYRCLWKGDSSHEEDDSHDEGGAGILKHAIQVHQLKREIERFREPIRLTPAEAAFSRRLFMFSDLTDKLAKVRFGERDSGKLDEKIQFLETAIACRDGKLQRETRVRIDFTAPRLNRDELLGGAESRWLQPMTAALALKQPKAEGKFNSAVALMPDRLADGTIRHLLNFPVDLDSTWLQESLGKAADWKGQFNGTKDKNLHLHWPSTAKDVTRKNPWWENKRILRNGFTILSNDLGQRSAGAWALLKITCWKPETKRPVRSVGHDGKHEWFAEVLKTGMYRLPGEEQKILKGGKWVTETSGQTGRMPSQEEYNAAVRLAEDLGSESIAGWLGAFGEKSLPQLADQLVRIANRRLTRLGTYHRWSCFAPDKLEDPERKEKVIEGQITELECYQDADVREWCALLKARDVVGFRDRASAAFDMLRDELEDHLVNLANFTAPLRQKLWIWQKRPGNTDYGDLVMEDYPDNHPKIRGQRGLSMARLEQLEGLRRLFLRYNRSLDRKAGMPAAFGRADRGRESGEPCQALLDKIDRMKDQRVDQTAHLILAQALGVRLKPHELSDKERAERDIHGEYEKIEGREPVDFIVIEDLSRYLSSQGRAPSENSKLMKWAHRAVRDKLKMLAEEPFGIPVVETVPAYSSRFHAANGQPGSRLHEHSGLDAYQFLTLEKIAGKKDVLEIHRAKAATELVEQFQILAKENAERRKSGKPPRTLLFPKAGGPLFLAARDGNPVQADMNAAVNLGLRAIAAPACIEVHRRIRASKEKEIYRPKLGNAREKAAFAKEDQIVVTGGISSKFKKSTTPNFFHEPDGLLQADGKPLFDRAELNGHALVSGVALWSMVNNAIYIRCAEINRQRLSAWKLNDEIPM